MVSLFPSKMLNSQWEYFFLYLYCLQLCIHRLVMSSVGWSGLLGTVVAQAVLGPGCLWIDWTYSLTTRKSRLSNLCVTHNNFSFVCCIFVKTLIFSWFRNNGLVRILGEKLRVSEKFSGTNQHLGYVRVQLGKAVACHGLSVPGTWQPSNERSLNLWL